MKKKKRNILQKKTNEPFGQSVNNVISLFWSKFLQRLPLTLEINSKLLSQAKDTSALPCSLLPIRLCCCSLTSSSWPFHLLFPLPRIFSPKASSWVFFHVTQFAVQISCAQKSFPQLFYAEQASLFIFRLLPYFFLNLIYTLLNLYVYWLTCLFANFIMKFHNYWNFISLVCCSILHAWSIVYTQ